MPCRIPRADSISILPPRLQICVIAHPSVPFRVVFRENSVLVCLQCRVPPVLSLQASADHLITNYLPIGVSRLRPVQPYPGGLHRLDGRSHLRIWRGFLCPERLRHRVSTACCRAGLQGQGIEGEGGQASEEKLPTQARVLQEPVAEDVVCLQEDRGGRCQSCEVLGAA